MTEPVDHEFPGRDGRPAGDGDVLRFEGAALTDPAAMGAPAVDGLTLECDERGIVILGPQPGAARTVWWSTVVAASCGAPVVTPTGRVATPLDVTSGDRTVRFLVFGDPGHEGEMAQLSRSIPAWLERSRPAHLGLPTVPVVAAAGAPGFDLAGRGAGHPPPPAGVDRPRARRWRARTGVAALLVLAVAWTGASGLVLFAGHRQPAAAPSGGSRTSPDQHLADQLMLTQRDLPSGWQVDNGANTGGNSPGDLKAERQIERTFAQCMGITDSQGSTALGGPAADQTAQTSSPVFVGPGAGAGAASGVELQTAADIVRTHDDELGDFTLFNSPKFPQCDASVVAAETQLGFNDATGGSDQAGPASATVATMPPFAGEQLVGLKVSFEVTDGTTQIPVAVDEVVVGSDRIEAELETFAIGTEFPAEVLSSSVSTFEQRVAAQGGGTTA